MMAIHVFIGPSLRLDEARTLLPAARFHPPVAMGQVSRLVKQKPSVIAIVDGLFEQVPSVWHKEILYALEQGVRVFGASSMGALRAAELHAFGMEGVGRIFDAYRTGELEDDDEIAVAHGPAESGYRNLSVAMITIREGLQRAEHQGIIAPSVHRLLVDIAKAQFYPERSWAALEDLGAARGAPQADLVRLRDFVKRGNPDLKAEDARTLLRRIADIGADGPVPPRPRFVLEKTRFWFQMIENTSSIHAGVEGLGGDEEDVTLDALLDHLRIVEGNVEIDRAVLFRHLVSADATRSGLAPNAEGLQAAADDFRRTQGILSSAATEAWLRSRQMTKADLAELLRHDLVVRELVKYYRTELRGLVPLELKRQGRFAEILDIVRRKQRVLRDQGIANPTLADAAVGEATLLAWYARRFRPFSGTLDGHASALGFESSREFLSAVLAQYLFEVSTRPRAEAEEVEELI
jgi:hypothetical protein